MKIIATTGVVGERGRVSAMLLVIVALLCGLLSAVLLARHFHARSAAANAPTAAAKPSDCDTPPAPAPAPAAPASASSAPSKPAPNFLTFAACSDGAKPAAKPAAPTPNR